MEREVLLGSTRAHCPSGTEEEQLSSLVLSHTFHVASAEQFLFAPLCRESDLGVDTSFLLCT